MREERKEGSPRWRSHVPMIFSICYCFLAGYWNSVMQVWVQHRVPRDTRELPDIGFQWLPHIYWYPVCDYLLACMVALTFLRFIFDTAQRERVFRRFFFIQGTIFFFRAISISITNLTLPHNGCVPTAHGNAFIAAFWIMAGYWRTCGDIMFSGHASDMTLMALSWQYYTSGQEWAWLCPQRGCIGDCVTGNRCLGHSGTCNLSIILMWSMTSIGYLLIIATHFHYSVDVFIGCLLAVLIFKLYMHFIETALYRREMIGRFFLWFEHYDTHQMQPYKPLKQPIYLNEYHKFDIHDVHDTDLDNNDMDADGEQFCSYQSGLP